MATIIDCGDGRYIAGDPPATLPAGRHWCSSCGGSGLEYDVDGDLWPCSDCDGSSTIPCHGGECETCALERDRLRYRRLNRLADLCNAAADRAQRRGDPREARRRLDRVIAAYNALREIPTL